MDPCDICHCCWCALPGPPEDRFPRRRLDKKICNPCRDQWVVWFFEDLQKRTSLWTLEMAHKAALRCRGRSVLSGVDNLAHLCFVWRREKPLDEELFLVTVYEAKQLSTMSEAQRVERLERL